ncbi:MAG: DUF2142 domain-containing protein [Anaerolineae bacterium]|nr:DUF2142 domain-containing protein [Anaerolineae bacterium]
MTIGRRHSLLRVLSIWVAEHKLRVVLLAGLLQGLLYTFMVPPWMNHDEPGHFEFAWQIAHFDHWPRADEFDPQMRLQVARAISKYGYYQAFDPPPDLSGDVPVFIGIPQHTQYPFYHLLASVPLRFLPDIEFDAQLRVVRLVSVLLFLLTLWLAWQALGEILPKDHPLQWLTVSFMALLPGLANIMTSVNDDAGAVLAFTLFLWICLRLLVRGFSWRDGLGLALSVVLCVGMKNTAWPAIPLGLVALLFSVFRNKFRWLPWVVLGSVLLIAPFVFFRWGDAELWYRSINQPDATRAQVGKSVVGNHALYLSFSENNVPLVSQIISIPDMRPLRGQRITIGAWMWADRQIKARIPDLEMKIHHGGVYREPSKYVTLTTVPTFYSLTFRIPLDAESGILRVWPLPALDEENPQVSIYLDGIVLARGKRDGAPQFDDPLGKSGIWSDMPFENIVQNGSAEKGWVYLSPHWVNIIGKAFPGSVDVLVASLQDPQALRGYYRAAFLQLFQTFWSKVPSSRADIPGGEYVYPLLQWITALGALGGIGILIKKRRVLSWQNLFFLGATMITVWGMTVARGGADLLGRSPLLPWARYAYPVILPTSLLLCAGWWQASGWLQIPAARRGTVVIAFMIALDILTLIGVMIFAS